MAGGKETPRQKMIGMMYLVLLAMLAMNVSKEIINAFVTLNNKIESQNQTFEESNRSVQNSIHNSLITAINDAQFGVIDIEEAYKRAKRENKTSVTKLYELLKTAESVDSLSKFTANRVMDYANDMLQEGQSGEWVVYDSSGYANIVHLNDPDDDYDKKDDYDTPTYKMVNQNNGRRMLEQINAYKKELCSRIASVEIKGRRMAFNPPDVVKKTDADLSYLQQVEAAFPDSADRKQKEAILEVYRILTFPEKVENHGDMVPWLVGQFDHSPMVAAAALFTSIKGQILQAAGVSLEFIASQNDVPPFKFDRIEPLAFANTSYINTGDSLNLHVMIGAYNSKASSKIRYVVDPVDSIVRPEDMKLVHNASSIKLGLSEGYAVGDHLVKGQISVEENGLDVWKDFEFTYKVGAPASAIGNSEMNIMYVGYDNKIAASGSGYNNVTATCQGCSGFTKSGDGYVARVSGGTRQVTVSVNGKDDEGNPVHIGKQEFRVLPMPKPKCVVPGHDPYESEISRMALSETYFMAQLVGSPLTMTSRVTGGKITIVSGTVAHPYVMTGNKIPSGAGSIIRRLPAGTTVIVDLTAVMGGKTVKTDTRVFRVR